jgi:hypothetical protein
MRMADDAQFSLLEPHSSNAAAETLRAPTTRSELIVEEPEQHVCFAILGDRTILDPDGAAVLLTRRGGR